MKKTKKPSRASRRAAPRCSTETIAKRIVRRLMAMTDSSSGYRDRATRLALMQAFGNGQERELGGMNRECVYQNVCEQLKRSGL